MTIGAIAFRSARDPLRLAPGTQRRKGFPVPRRFRQRPPSDLEAGGDQGSLSTTADIWQYTFSVMKREVEGDESGGPHLLCRHDRLTRSAWLSHMWYQGLLGPAHGWI